MKFNVFQYKREKAQNPYIGFTSFQHFKKDELYSDLIVKPENNMTETEHVECYPVPDYVEEKGRAQGYYPDCSVVYIRILWKEFEPREGEYNYEFIEDILNKARENDQTVMFRLMQHSTRESDDVPDWLKTKMECPARPEGMRVKDCPRDPKFLEYFGRAVRAFGERFDSDPTLAFMDISMPGAWGEGSHVKLFTPEQLKNFADVYTHVFKNTLLIGQTCAGWLLHYLNESAPVGWRADCIGNPGCTYDLIPTRLKEFPAVWKRGHISTEAYWWLGEWQRKGWELDKIIETTLGWHISTFNAKSLPIPFEWTEKIDEWIAKMGYHFQIQSFAYPEEVSAGERVETLLSIENVGVAPIYHKLPLKIRFVGMETFEWETDVDVREWLPGTFENKIAVTLPKTIKRGAYKIQIALGGGGYPIAYFATDAKEENDWYEVGKTQVK